ncbi:MAG: hypothetical protein KFF50_15725 [Desulfatitalea sp.]|nr:hypothetical protein [Desulfatitalea sp.]
MNVKEIAGDKSSIAGKRLRAWLGLALGLGLLWSLAYVVLPWGQTLPHVRPIMASIEQSNIDAGAYWYTQSEETARAQMFVRNAIRKHR